MKRNFILLLLSLFSVFTSHAQKIFSEGAIKYDVFLKGSTEPDGIYVISVKAGFIKQEWAMKNGFNNITIYNQKTGITLSLNTKDETRYALEITQEELKQKNKRFENAVFTPSSTTKKIAGYSTTSSKVTYKSGDEVDIFYTSDLIPQNETFNTMFPGLNGIPLEYVTISSGANSMKFVASLVEIKVLDNSVFNIPADYKIISKAELEKLK